jgi:hypothetical protein
MVGEIDEAMLLAACKSGGRRVTQSQLKRWRGAGLVQRPRQEHPRGRRGSVSWYPEAAVEQALAVAELLGDERRRNDWVLVQLWWRGMWIDEAVLRARLVEHFDAVSRDARKLAATHEDPLDAADAAVRGMQWRDPTPINDAMLERLGGRRRGRRPLEDIMWFFFVLAFGGDYEPEPEADGTSVLEEKAARATGMDRAKRDVGPTREAWLANDTTALGVVRELHRAGALDVLISPRPSERNRPAASARR